MKASVVPSSSASASSIESAIPQIPLVSQQSDVPSAESYPSSYLDSETHPLNPLPDPVLLPAEGENNDHEASGSTNTRSESAAEMDSITLVPVDEDESSDADDGRWKGGSKPGLRYLSAPLNDGRVSLSRVTQHFMSCLLFDRLFPSRFIPDILLLLLLLCLSTSSLPAGMREQL